MTDNLPPHLTLAVDCWFRERTGLGGCSDKDVSELAEIFYGVQFDGGRESVDDAMAIVEYFGPGISGLNDTFARQVLLAAEVKRLRAAIAQAQSCVPAVKATDQRVTFDTWLRSVCLQAPPDHAQDLARSAWYASDKQASADCEAMAEEIERLQKALAFWMPDVPSTDHPLYKRVANDVYLLVGFDGPNPEPSAFELGHVVLAESQPTLWAIHVPGPDDYYPSPSEEAANHMASKHNAAMTEWFKENPDTSGNRPPIESSLASAKQWPGSGADHAEEIAVFDYAAWGLASPQPQPVQPGEPDRKPLSDDQRYDLIVENLGPSALTGGKMTPWDIFMLGISACETAHGIAAPQPKD